METIEAWIAILRNIPTRPIFFALCFLLLLHALRKIKVRRPRSWAPDSDEEPPEEKPRPAAVDKGQLGEDLIADILYDTVTGEFVLFRNAYVPNGGKTSEIDLVMVHEKGLFVFESKNYNGVISGSMDALNWVHIHPNRKKYTFYNPVRQNRNHIRALSRYLRIPEKYFYSCVVFSKQCKLERVPENTRSVTITRTPELAERLDETLSALPTRYDAGQVRNIAERLLPLTDADSSVKEKHIRDIREEQESNICPWCGGELVAKRGKYGPFWGCSSYPECAYRRNMTR